MTSPHPSDKRSLEGFLLYLIAMELVLAVGVPAQLYSLSIGLAITELVVILLPALLLVRLRQVPVREAWRIKFIPISWGACALLLSVSGLPLVLAIRNMTVPAVTAIFGAAPDSSGLMQNASHAGLSLFWWLVAAALLPGICEEALFRGTLLGILERKGSMRAIVITGGAFALFHVNPWNFVAQLGLRLALSFVTLRSQSIVPAMLWHATTNAMAFTVYAKNDHLPWWLTLVSAITFAAAAKWFFYLTKDQIREPSPLAFPAPPGNSPVRRLALSALTIGAVPVLGAVLCFLPTVFPTDKFAPEIPRGSVGIILRNRFRMVTIRPGDWISYTKERKLYIRRVARISPQMVWISDKTEDGQNTEKQLSLSDVTGKLIKHFEPLQHKGP